MTDRYIELKDALKREAADDPLAACNIIVDAIAVLQAHRTLNPDNENLLKRIRAHAASGIDDE